MFSFFIFILCWTVWNTQKHSAQCTSTSF